MNHKTIDFHCHHITYGTSRKNGPTPVVQMLRGGGFFCFRTGTLNHDKEVKIYSKNQDILHPLNRNRVASRRPSPSRGATLRRRYELVKSYEGLEKSLCRNGLYVP